MRNAMSSFEEVIEKEGRLVYTNVGDSMMPLIKQGRDLLIIEKKPAGRLKRLDIPLYKRDNGQYVLHRVIKVRENDYVICGDNRYSRERGITDRHIIGLLTSVVRNGKELKMSDPRVRLYSHLWCDLFFIRAGILYFKSIPKRLKRKWKKRKESTFLD